MRSGDELDEAVEFCKKQGIEFYGIGKDPKQSEWTKSNKAYGIFSIDDRNIGVPLYQDEGEDRPCVDWKEIDKKYGKQIIELAKKYKKS